MENLIEKNEVKNFLTESEEAKAAFRFAKNEVIEIISKNGEFNSRSFSEILGLNKDVKEVISVELVYKMHCTEKRTDKLRICLEASESLADFVTKWVFYKELEEKFHNEMSNSSNATGLLLASLLSGRR